MDPERVIAVCQGGPLDGQLFSVPLSDGEPEPMYSRADVLGEHDADGTLTQPLLYKPVRQVEHTLEQQGQFAEAALENGEIVLRQIPHQGAWLYELAEAVEAQRLYGAWVRG